MLFRSKLYFIMLLGVLLVPLSLAEEGTTGKTVSGVRVKSTELAGEVDRSNKSGDQLKGESKILEEISPAEGSPFSFEELRKRSEEHTSELQSH